MPEIRELAGDDIYNKPTFGSVELCYGLKEAMLDEEVEADGNLIESITLVGLCTDICVISNAMLLKAFFPEVPVIVDASCCAGVTPESHENALRLRRCARSRWRIHRLKKKKRSHFAGFSFLSRFMRFLQFVQILLLSGTSDSYWLWKA